MHKSARVPQNRAMIKYAVRAQLQGRVFVCFLACLIPMVLPWVMRLIPVSFGAVHILVIDTILYRISLPMLALSFVATTFVTDPMTVKVAGFFLVFNRDPEHLPSPLTVCDCFGPGYLRLVSAMLQRTIRVFAWSAIPLVVGAVIPGMFEQVDVSGISAIRVNDWYYWFILAAAIVNLYRGLSYSMVPYLLADEPDISASEALRRSVHLTKGRIWELFVLQLSFFGWLMLVSITFMIGAIYAYPYLEGTMAAYYIAFTQPAPWELDRDDEEDAY